MLGRRSQRDFEDEIRSHLQLEIDRLKAQGMTDEQATYAARRHFGNVTAADDRFYHGRPLVSADNVIRDVHHALRSLLRSRGFLVTTVATLALAIGAVAGMFDVVNTVMLRPLPFPNADRLVFLEGTAPGTDLADTLGLGGEFYVHYKENSKLLAGLSTFISLGTSTLRVGDRVERIRMAWPTNDLYSTLQMHPQLGRLPRTEDGDDAVLISDRLWTTWFNRDPSVIGKWYFVSDSMKQVIGVMPKEFIYPSDLTLLWVSGEMRASDVQAPGFGPPLVARMKEGVTREQLAVEMKQLAPQIPTRFGFTRPAYTKIIGNFRPVVTPMMDRIIGPTVKTSLLILLGAVAVVLLIACANVANLFLVRAETRRRDLTVRRAIGASRAQLMRFQMTEAFVVAIIAGVLAVALAGVALPLFVRSAPEGIPRLADVHIDFVTVVTGFALVVFVALACGAAPAIRGSSPDLSGLRAGGRGSIAGRQWGRELLVIAQTALALVLLIGSALLLQSFRRLRSVDPGYDVRNVYTFQYAPEQPQWRDGPTFGQLHLMMMDRFRALPGVTTVGVVDNIPLDEGTRGVRVLPEGAPGGSDGIQMSMTFTGGDYFKTIGIKLLGGRAFTNDEAVTPNTSAIVSKSAAEKLFPGQSALGHRIRPRFGGQDTLAFTVVGVVNDVKQLDWKDPGQAIMYLPLTGPTAGAWRMGSPAYVIKSVRAELMKNEVRKIIHEVAPEAPVYREFTMEFLTRRSMLELSFTTLTLGVLSALAVILGAVGLYGTLSYVVAQRTREIGVRMALGATARAVRSQVVAQGTKVVLIGAVIGVVAAYMTTRFLTKLLYGVKPADPVAFAAMAALMIAVGMVASYMPARRASSVDPMEALRSD
jgi:putative ABC transport system permease protein